MTADTMLRQTADRLFAQHILPATRVSAEQGVWPQAAWDAVEAAGLTRALVPEEAGGYGLEPAEALQVLSAAGQHAVPLPLAETMLASWLLAGAGIDIPDGPLSIAGGDGVVLREDGGGWRVAGHAVRVPWGRDVQAVAVLAGGRVALVPAAGFRAEHDENLAREPRDTLHFDALLPADQVAPAASGVTPPAFRAMGAAMRSLQMAGALAEILAMTTQYALDRKQFGRPIGKFQAIQQNMAILAAQQAAASAAADGAAEAVGAGIRMLPIAAAKIRAGEAAGIGAAIAHQVHGAIGFTYEHRLHFFTKRLWSWRDEFGSEAEWSLLLGRHMAAAGPDRLWSEITSV
jgi:acyl-CoA dehydrogenase